MIAYRDDLEAAQLRVRDLEREHAALQAHNAELERLASPKSPAVEKALPKELWDYTGIKIAFAALMVCGVIGILTERYGWLKLLGFGAAAAFGRILDAGKTR